MTKVCICQICTCGRHHCPHHPTGVINKGDQPCQLSEYANKYHPHPIDARHDFKPKYEPKTGGGPMEDKTTHKVDFIKYPMEKPFVHQSDTYRPPEGDFDPMTNYKKDYNQKPMERTKAIRKDLGRRLPGKFEGHPTYKNDYRRWSLDKRQPINQDPGYRPSSQPFEGLSNYTSDYIKRHAPVRASMKPAGDAKLSDQPFDGRTGYRDEYVKHVIPEKFQKEKAVYNPNGVPMDGLSNYMKDYIPRGAEKTVSCKPDPNPYQSGAPLDDDTTNRVDYKKWPLEKPFVHTQGAWVKPDGDMNMFTTSHTDYTKKPMDRSLTMKPIARPMVPGKFSDATNYKEDYRKWDGERAQPTNRGGEYQAPDVPFEGNTNYHDDYLGHKAAVRQSMKPAGGGYASGAPFEGATMYRTDYTKKRVLPCPAGVIEGGGNAGYMFSTQDPQGHKWYQPVSVSVTEIPTAARVPSAQLTALSVA